MDATKKKGLLIAIAISIVLIVCVALLVYNLDGIGIGKSGKTEYIGTRAITNILGAKLTCETVIILEKGTYSLTVTVLQNGVVTLNSSGYYETIGSNNNIIVFTDSSGQQFQGQFIYGGKTISLAYSGLREDSSYAYSCSKT